MNDIGECDTATRPQRHAANFLPPGGRIVVGVDNSPASKTALRAAARIAELTGATLDAVGVWEFPISYVAYGYAQGFGPHTDWNPEKTARRRLTATLDDVFGPNRPEGLRMCLLLGDPAKRILEQAEGASLVVVGSRGHRSFAGLMLDSVSTKCAEGAHCPVLIVHASVDSPNAC
jgi:nucleotide-binding universal stress UspA family protein